MGQAAGPGAGEEEVRIAAEADEGGARAGGNAGGERAAQASGKNRTRCPSRGVRPACKGPAPPIAACTQLGCSKLRIGGADDHR